MRRKFSAAADNDRPARVTTKKKKKKMDNGRSSHFCSSKQIIIALKCLCRSYITMRNADTINNKRSAMDR